jgi:hypothetical protein
MHGLSNIKSMYSCQPSSRKYIEIFTAIRILRAMAVSKFQFQSFFKITVSWNITPCNLVGPNVSEETAAYFFRVE